MLEASADHVARHVVSGGACGGRGMVGGRERGSERVLALSSDVIWLFLLALASFFVLFARLLKCPKWGMTWWFWVVFFMVFVFRSIDRGGSKRAILVESVVFLGRKV